MTAGLTWQKLAAGTGVQLDSVAKWERGKAPFSGMQPVLSHARLWYRGPVIEETVEEHIRGARL